VISMLLDGSLVSDEWTSSPLGDLVLSSLFTPRGAFFLRPDFGSDLHLLKGAKASESTLQLARRTPSSALKWAIDAGLLDSVVSQAEFHGSQLLLRVEISAGAAPLVLEIWLPVVAGGAT